MLSSNQFLDFAIEFGRLYLVAGGPSSRIEEGLAAVGLKYGYKTEVFATGTGIFVNSISVENGHNETSLGRVKESTMNLSRLCWMEALLDDIHSGKVSLRTGLRILKTSRFQASVYTLPQTFVAAFAMGIAVSYPTFNSPGAALASGLITVGTFWIAGPGFKTLIPSSVFRDFLGCLFTLLAAFGTSMIIGAPLEAHSIGGIILLVPGLALTTAISELADQNFIAGTAKLMKAVLTLLAIGIAYLLFQDLSPSLYISQTFGQRHTSSSLVSMVGILLSVFGFGVLFQVPRKVLPWSTFTGLVGWVVLHQFENGKLLVMASFLASLSVGTISLAFGTKFRVPSQAYSVPGILAMLPGMLALSSFRSFAAGQGDSGIETAFKVTLVASAIVFGLFCSRIPFAITTNLMARKK